MPKVTALLSRRLTLKERVLLYAVPNSATQCWEWSGNRDRHGYGTVTYGGRPQLAHRASWEVHHGEISPGLFVCHRCDNRACVNPAHLFLGTAKENSADMHSKGRAANNAGEAHGGSKLTDADVICIYQRIQAGEVQRNIARDYGVSPMTISNIGLRKRWRHLTEKQSA